jgi:hypothetical protein
VHLNRFLDSVYLLALMVGFYPAIFFISNNWFFVGIFQSFCLLAVLSFAAFIAISIVHLIVSWIRLPRVKNSSGNSATSMRLPVDVQAGLIVILSVHLLIRFLQVTMVDLQKTYPALDIRLSIFLAGSCIVILLLLVARKLESFRPNLIRFFNVFLLVLSVAALVNLTLSVISNYDAVFGDAADSAATKLDTDDASVYRQVHFNTAPNIYLIVPDSYPSNPFLQQFFNFDNSKFTHKLQSVGFRVYDDYFSAYPFSVESMHSMLAMEHSFFGKSIGNDSVDLREIIGGRGNHVVNVMKQNGYRSVFLHESDYLVKQHCRIEACLPQRSELSALKENAKEFFALNLPIAESDYDVGQAMQLQIAAVEAEDKVFTYKHFMDAHSTVKSYKKSYRQLLPEFRKAYPAKIQGVNKTLLKEVDQVLGKDPSAIIIIVADHGTWAGAERSKTGLSESETRDKLNVFLAIRWGAGYDGRYDDEIKTSVNMFRFIFAYLSQDEKILETLKEDDGYFKTKGKVWKVVENGVVLEKPRRH